MPAEVADPRYWAFISYSHADEAWARWLHGTIETWRVPWRLVGHPHPDGPIPRRLFPVFRDRDELSSSHELGGAIRQALAQSRYLIVICSPRSAASRWVNEEIRHFKAMGREARVLALIVDGEPGSASAECFAPALSRRVSVDGTVLDTEAVEPIAADVRSGRDSRRHARLRLLAGMLGIGFDALQRRERRRLIWRAASAATLSVALLAAASSAWQWRERQIAETGRQQSVQRLTAIGREALQQGAYARATAALKQAVALGGNEPALNLALHQATAVSRAWLRRWSLGAPARRVALSADGRRAAAVSKHDHIAVWDAASGAELFRGEPSGTGFESPAKPLFSADGRYLLRLLRTVSGAPSQLRIIDLERGGDSFDGPVAASNPHGWNHSFSTDSRWATWVEPDGGVTIWDLERRQAAEVLSLPVRARVAALAPQGMQIAVGDIDGGVTLYAQDTGRSIRRYEGLDDPVITLAFSPDGRYLAAGDASGAVRIWQTASGELHATAGHRFAVEGLQFSHDARRYLSLADDGVRVWDNRNGALIRAPDLAHAQSHWPALHPDGEQLVLTDGDRAILMDTASGRVVYDYDAHLGGAFDADFDATGRHVVIGGADGNVSLWRHPAFPLVQYAHGDALHRRSGTAVTHVAYSPDGTYFASAATDGRVQIRRSSDGQLQRTLGGHLHSVEVLLWEPDGKGLVTIQYDGVVRRFEVASGSQTWVRETGWIQNFWVSRHLSADGQQLLLPTENPDRPITLIELASGEFHDLTAITAVAPMPATAGVGPWAYAIADAVRVGDPRDDSAVWSWPIPPLNGDPAEVATLAASADGHHLFVGLSDGRLALLDARSGTLRASHDERNVPAVIAGISTDGRYVALMRQDEAIQLWTLQNQQLQPLLGHGGTVHSFTFAPDGNFLATASFDGSARLWSSASGRELAAWRLHAGGINTAALHPDGGQLLIGSADNRVSLIELRTDPHPLAEPNATQRCSTIWLVEDETLLKRAPVNCNAVAASAVPAHADAP